MRCVSACEKRDKETEETKGQKGQKGLARVLRCDTLVVVSCEVIKRLVLGDVL